MIADAARVYLAAALPAVFAAPLLRRAFPSLGDGGWTIARPVGWILVAWPAWIVASISPVPYGTWLVVASLFALAAAGGAVAWADRVAWRDLARARGRTWLLAELLGVLVFALLVWAARFNGDVHPLAERFMDYAILKRLSLSTHFPPDDSWMAGMTLQYYYYGYHLMDVVRRIAGLPLRDFFNLGIPVVYASFAMALFGAGLVLTGRRAFAMFAALGGAFVGNYEFARQLLVRRFDEGRWAFGSLDWFAAARVIPGTINETPAFAAFWGDLHPYVIAFPLVAAAVALVVAMAREGESPFSSARPRRDRLLALAVLSLALGSLYPTNSWDYPTFLALAVAAMAMPLVPPIRTARGAFAALRPAAGWAAALVLLSVLLYLPFHIGFGKQVGRGVGIATLRSDAAAMLVHFGPWVLVVAIWAWTAARSGAERRGRLLPLALAIVGLVAYERWGTAPVEGLLHVAGGDGGVRLAAALSLEHLLLRGLSFVLLIALLWTLLADLPAGALRTGPGIARLLVAAAFGVVLVCEFAYVDDFYDGEKERMNTIFKAYVQAWILLAVGGAGLLAASWTALADRRRARIGFAAALAAVLLPSLLFALLADASRSSGFTRTRSGNEPTLDPLSLFEKRHPYDAAAVAWVDAHLPPDSRIVEAADHAYKWESRFATFTGRIGLVGWKNHESGWRNDWAPATQRGHAIDQIYTAPDLETARAAARRYDADYVVVGELEQDTEKYPEFRLAKFEALEAVYRNERVSIYRLSSKK